MPPLGGGREVPCHTANRTTLRVKLQCVYWPFVYKLISASNLEWTGLVMMAENDVLYAK